MEDGIYYFVKAENKSEIVEKSVANWNQERWADIQAYDDVGDIRGRSAAIGRYTTEGTLSAISAVKGATQLAKIGTKGVAKSIGSVEGLISGSKNISVVSKVPAIGTTLRGAKAPIQVTAEIKLPNGKYLFDTNQSARPKKLANPDKPTLIAEYVEKGQPNSNMANAHAEYGENEKKTYNGLILTKEDYMFNYMEQFFALSSNNSMKFTIQSDYFNFEKSDDFSTEIMDSKLEEFFVASNDTGGWATLEIIKPKYPFICSVSMEIINRKQYTMLIKLSGDYEDTLYWWNPNCEIYNGYIEIPAIQPYPIDKRRVVDNIKYAQLLFYEFYKYGTLSDNVMANFRHIDNPKPKYYLQK